MKPIVIIVIGCLFSLMGCKEELTGLSDVYRWINNPKHGLVKSKTVDDLTLTVKYLPAEFLALKESKEEATFKKKTYDSLLKIYSQSRTFLLTIASSTNQATNDPIYRNLNDVPGFKERVLSMNFEMNSFLSLNTTAGVIKPSLTTMENIYGLKGERSVYVVFADETEHKSMFDSDEFDFVFDDTIFQTGENHFVFNQRDIDLPAINFKRI